MNTCHKETTQMPANEEAITAAVEQEPWRSACGTAWKLGLSQQTVIEVLHYYQFQPSHCAWITHPFPDDCTLLINFADDYDINTMWMTSFHKAFCGHMKHIFNSHLWHRIILMLSANVGEKSASVSASGLELSGILADCSIKSWFSGNCSTRFRSCLKMCL
jgi:hypothetical protein